MTARSVLLAALVAVGAGCGAEVPGPPKFNAVQATGFAQAGAPLLDAAAAYRDTLWSVCAHSSSLECPLRSADRLRYAAKEAGRFNGVLLTQVGGSCHRAVSKYDGAVRGITRLVVEYGAEIADRDISREHGIRIIVDGLRELTDRSGTVMEVCAP